MKKYTFDAEIQEGRGGGAYVVFPYEAEREFGTNGKVPVAATIDGVPDKSALMRMGMPHHILGVRKAIRDKLGKKPGNVVTIVLWKDDEPREITVPPELEKRRRQASYRSSRA